MNPQRLGGPWMEVGRDPDDEDGFVLSAIHSFPWVVELTLFKRVPGLILGVVDSQHSVHPY